MTGVQELPCGMCCNCQQFRGRVGRSAASHTPERVDKKVNARMRMLLLVEQKSPVMARLATTASECSSSSELAVCLREGGGPVGPLWYR